MTRDTSPTPEAIKIDDKDNSLSLDHATMFKTLKNLLNDRIKPAMEARFTALKNMFTKRIEGILDQMMEVVANTQAQSMHQILDQLKQDNDCLQRQVANLTKEVRNMVAAKTTSILTSPTMEIPFLLISGLEVEATAVERNNLRQHAAGKSTPEIHRESQAPCPALAPTSASTFWHPPSRACIATVKASAASILPIQ